ncbi:MAG: hypothetical protein IJH05_03515 [Firmicutes bacterium]|nr:hypothetical protein [Bacillota bacterium]
MAAYATVEDVTTLWRALSATEAARVEELLPLVSDALRYEAVKAGKDLDQMIAENESLESVAKLVTIDVVSRVLRQNTTGETMTQESQAALGYSWSGTYAIPGGGIANAIMNNDLKRLGIKRQKIGVIEPYGDYRNNCNFIR